ncbi:ATP-binding cassette domain-containing protein [Candidatus Enterococcus mansonii]|uniref:ABC transporter domain-containing protein n=1 Tax=Candidatus Enterococcus mansonii TaxID=1834181 RepID=A0A242CEL4_9ENTE|nr:ATP-binding cassette domain-containing protein [Enterococcus sp. 4G2_DIV0659]OTO08677.1 hypothetical protein A5880_001677 [Enterococcus sp. 4G2_DIV0659]
MYAHYMQKSSSDCGIASLRTILEQLQIKLKTTSELYKNYSIKKDQGLSLGEVGEILTQYGVLSSAYEVENFEELKSVKQFPMLLVVENDGCAHYIVVHEIKGQTFTVSDPAEPKLKTYDEEYIRSIFLGYALCIDDVGMEIEEQEKKDKVESIGKILYKEMMVELSMKTKLSMIVLLLLKYILPILSTFIIQLFMQSMTKTALMSDIIGPIIIILWLIVFFYMVNVKEGKQRVRIENKLQEKILMKYYNQKINDLDSGKNLDNVTGYFWNLIYSVTGLLQKFYFKLNVAYVIFLSLLLFLLSPYLAGALVLWTGIYALYLNNNKKKIKNNEMNLVGKSSAFVSGIESTLKTSLDINLFSKKKQSEQFIKEKLTGFLEAKVGTTVNELNLFTVYQSFITLMSVTTFLIVSLTVIYGQEEQLINTSNGIFVISIILSSLAPVVQNWLSYQKSHVAIDYIQSTNDYQKNLEFEEKKALDIENIQSITIEGLTFGYEENHTILHNFHVTLEAGCIYGIKGENGAGKSTLIKLLSGILEPQKGSFIINQKQKEHSLKQTTINEHISMYSQEFNVYGNTVGRNIRYKVFNEKLENSEKNTYQDLFQLKLPNNYLLQSDGVNISQGQKQKILLMRALYQEKSVYIFDEPTGNLDEGSKKLLMKEIQRLAKEKNKLVILISHEEDVLSYSDEIITINKGEEN